MASEVEADRDLDLQGEVCPYTFVKSKLALEQMVSSQTGSCCVVDGNGGLEGVLSLQTLIAAIERLESEAREHYANGSTT